MISPEEALQRLRRGNRRYVAYRSRMGDGIEAERRAELVGGQAPFAAVLGCSDSRVPPEMVFDRGPGDLFVIRVAGNLAGPLEIGSVEFAVDKLGTPLVAVLGHTGCGAIGATLDALRSHPGRAGERPDGPLAPELGPNLGAIVERIRPAVAPLLDATGEPAEDPESVAEDAVRANVLAEVERLRDGSELLRQSVAEGKLLIVGAEYSLDSGVVDFFDLGAAR